ncbi:MAG TPA: methyltransferase [Gammaproteobacteria bacterium]|nr:methyltransferase [Gammaproteobacteria bacterium]
MLDASLPSLLDGDRPGRFGNFVGKLMGLAYRVAGAHRYDRLRIEHVLDLPIVVLPSVANPKVLRTGAFFASRIDGRLVAADADVLDLGTGSGVCALFAARHARRVVAVDINPEAVRCATVNALMNRLDKRIALRQGDLFAPVADERFDLVLFNPPFIVGAPKDARDAAWRSSDLPQRFASGLAAHLKSGGAALVLLPSFGDACPRYEAELRASGFRLELFARRRYVNETVTILRATPPTKS